MSSMPVTCPAWPVACPACPVAWLAWPSMPVTCRSHDQHGWIYDRHGRSHHEHAARAQQHLAHSSRIPRRACACYRSSPWIRASTRLSLFWRRTMTYAGEGVALTTSLSLSAGVPRTPPALIWQCCVKGPHSKPAFITPARILDPASRIPHPFAPRISHPIAHHIPPHTISHIPLHPTCTPHAPHMHSHPAGGERG